MKYQKLDSKQLPQMIILGVLCLGVVSWIGYSVVSASTPPKRTVSKKVQTGEDKQVAKATSPGTTEATAAALTPVPSLPLSDIYNPDPFRAARVPGAENRKPGTASVRVKPAPPAPRPAVQAAREYRGQPLPGFGALMGGAPLLGGTQQSVRPVPVIPPAPVRPEVTLTGVIDVDEGSDMALLALNGTQQIFHVGDVVANNYRILEIRPDSILLVNGRDRFHVTLGVAVPGEPRTTLAAGG